MRMVGALFLLEAELDHGALDVALQRHQRRRRLDARPQHVRLLQRRKGAEPSSLGLDRLMARRHAMAGPGHALDQLLADRTEELERQMQVRRRYPGDAKTGVAHRRLLAI